MIECLIHLRSFSLDFPAHRNATYYLGFKCFYSSSAALFQGCWLLFKDREFSK